jgi:hypothetical protein
MFTVKSVLLASTAAHMDEVTLKGPKLEILVAEFLTQTKPVWVDDLETRI